MPPIRSGFPDQSLDFQDIKKITHETGFFWHFLNKSFIVNLTLKIHISLDSFTESEFLKEMVQIFPKISPDLVWILNFLVWNLNWRH